MERSATQERPCGSNAAVRIHAVLFGLLLIVAIVLSAAGTSLFAQDDQLRPALDNLVAAYPNALAGHDAKVLRWRDGTIMPVSDGADNKTFPELLRHASIIDQFRVPYPRGPLEQPPAVDADPGRFRDAAFFTKRTRCRRASSP
jgi:hypothetical protein